MLQNNAKQSCIAEDQQLMISDFSLVVSKEEKVTQGFPQNSSQLSLRNHATAPSSQSQEFNVPTTQGTSSHNRMNSAHARGGSSSHIHHAQKEYKTIGLVFLNNRVRTRVYTHETMDSFTKRLSLTLEIETEHELGFLPLGHHDKVLGRAEPIQKVSQCGQSTHLRKDANKGGKTQGAPLDMERLLQEKIAAQSEKKKAEEEEDADEPHMIPESAIIRSLKELRNEKFYLLVYIKLKGEVEEVAAEEGILTQQGEKPLKISSSTSGFHKHAYNTYNYSIERARRPKGEHRTLTCPFFECLKEFAETGNLKTHLRTHTGERPFVCSYGSCGKQFITKGHLKTHELIHSGDKPYQCEVCGKCYSRSGRLKIHVRTHTGEKPFRCPLASCGKTFTEKGNLKTHLRIHSGEKPFACSLPGCHKTFTTQGHLTDHLRRHSGDRPFKCSLCVQAFMRSSTLKIHMKRHTEEEDFDGNLSKAIEHMIEEEGDEEESSSDSEVESPEDEEVAYSSIDDQISYDSEKSPAKSEMIRKVDCEARKFVKTEVKSGHEREETLESIKGKVARQQQVGLKRTCGNSSIEPPLSKMTEEGLGNQKQIKTFKRRLGMVAEVQPSFQLCNGRCPNVSANHQSQSGQPINSKCEIKRRGPSDQQQIECASTVNKNHKEFIQNIDNTELLKTANKTVLLLEGLAIKQNQESIKQQQQQLQSLKAISQAEGINCRKQTVFPSLTEMTLNSQGLLKSNSGGRTVAVHNGAASAANEWGLIAIKQSQRIRSKQKSQISQVLGNSSQEGANYQKKKKRVKKNAWKEFSAKSKQSPKIYQSKIDIEDSNLQSIFREEQKEGEVSSILMSGGGSGSIAAQEDDDHIDDRQYQQVPPSLPNLQQEDNDSIIASSISLPRSSSSSSSSIQSYQSQNALLCSNNCDEQMMLVDEIIGDTRRHADQKQSIFELQKQCSSPFQIVRKNYNEGIFSISHFGAGGGGTGVSAGNNGGHGGITSSYAFSLNQALLGSSPSAFCPQFNPPNNGSATLTPMNGLGAQVSIFSQGAGTGGGCQQQSIGHTQFIRTRPSFSLNSGVHPSMSKVTYQRQLSFNNADQVQNASLFNASNPNEHFIQKENDANDDEKLVKFEKSLPKEPYQSKEFQKRNRSIRQTAAGHPTQVNQGVTSPSRKILLPQYSLASADHSKVQCFSSINGEADVPCAVKGKADEVRTQRNIGLKRVSQKKIDAEILAFSSKGKQNIEVPLTQTNPKSKVITTIVTQPNDTRARQIQQQHASLDLSPCADNEEGSQRQLDGVFISHDERILTNILQSPDLFTLMKNKAHTATLKKQTDYQKKGLTLPLPPPSHKLKVGQVNTTHVNQFASLKSAHQSLIDRWRSLQSPSSASNLNDIIQNRDNIAFSTVQRSGFSSNLCTSGAAQKPLYGDDGSKSLIANGALSQGQYNFDRSPSSKMKFEKEEADTKGLLIRSLRSCIAPIDQSGSSQICTTFHAMRHATQSSTVQTQAEVSITPILRKSSSISPPQPDLLKKSSQDSLDQLQAKRSYNEHRLKYCSSSPLYMKSQFVPLYKAEEAAAAAIFKVNKVADRSPSVQNMLVDATPTYQNFGDLRNSLIGNEKCQGGEKLRGFLLHTPTKEANEVNSLHAENFSSIVSKLRRSLSKSSPRKIMRENYVTSHIDFGKE